MKTKLSPYTINDWKNPSFWRTIGRAFLYLYRNDKHSVHYRARFECKDYSITQHGLCWAIKYLIHQDITETYYYSTPAHKLMNKFKPTSNWPCRNKEGYKFRYLTAFRIARFVESCNKRNLDPLNTPIDFFVSKKKN